VEGGWGMNIYHDIKYRCDYDKEYIVGVHNCKTLIDLRKYLENWRWIAEDSYQQSHKMTENRFKKFKSDAKKEAKGKFTNNEDFMVIALPFMMIQVSAIKGKFMVPFGVAFNRLLDLGILKIENGKVVGFNKQTTPKPNQAR